MDQELRAWPLADEPPDWRSERSRWEGGHVERRVLLGAGAVATGAAIRAGR